MCFRTMISQITSHEEHVAELMDRIALMEEQLRRVRVDSVWPQRDIFAHLTKWTECLKSGKCTVGCFRDYMCVVFR